MGFITVLYILDLDLIGRGIEFGGFRLLLGWNECFF